MTMRQTKWSALAFSLALLFGLSTRTANAQYRRTDGDTIRIREITNTRMVLSTPDGPIELRSEHDATIALLFGRADSARAWYERLRIAAISPQGRQEPATGKALSLPFVLSFDDRGRIQTLSAPEFPASFEAVTDLSHQFDDLFLRLPSAPLAIGLAWTDTAAVDAHRSSNDFMRGERITRTRVARDTTISGEPAWVIESVQSISITGSAPVKGQPLIARTRLDGADSGVFVFSRQNGRMLARQRTGGLSGTLTYEGGRRPVVLPMRQSYENSVQRVP